MSQFSPRCRRHARRGGYGSFYISEPVCENVKKDQCLEFLVALLPGWLSRKPVSPTCCPCPGHICSQLHRGGQCGGSEGRPGALVSQRRWVPGAAARSVRAALAGPGSQLACLPVFFSIPQSVVLTGKALDVAVGLTAGPCVHAGPDPPVAQHLVTCRRFASDVPAWSTCSGQSSLGEVCFPPAREREQGA